MQLNGAYVYLHLKEDNGEPFYVGIGTSQSRPWDMWNRSDWHRKTSAKHGVRVEILIDGLDKETAKWWEKRHIKALRDAGYNIVNMTDGGDGMHGFLHSEESKQKASKSHLAKGENHHNKTIEHREKVSKGLRALGDNHPMKNESSRSWKKSEWELKFGGSPMKIPEIAAKTSATMLAKGDAHQCKRPEVREKIKKSCGMYLSWFSTNAKWQKYWGA